jgi:hypothetical protein
MRRSVASEYFVDFRDLARSSTTQKEQKSASKAQFYASDCIQNHRLKLASGSGARAGAFDYCLFLMFPISRYIVLAQ